MRHNLFVCCFLFISILSTCTTEDEEQPEFVKQIHKCNYIGHTIKFTADSKYTFSIQQMDKIIQIEKPDERPTPGNSKVTYYLNIPETSITTGSAYFEWSEEQGKTTKKEIIFTDYFFEPDLGKTIDYGILNVTKLQCDGARDYIKFRKADDKTEVNIEKIDCGFDFRNASPGEYEVIAVNPYTNEANYVNSFTHIKEKTEYKAGISFELPTQTMPSLLNMFVVTYPKNYSKMLKMKITPDTSVELELTEDSSFQHGYFEFKDDLGENFEYKVFLNCSEEVVYHVSQILFSDHYYVNFKEDEYQIGHFFFINEPYYALEDSLIVTLSFYSKEQAKNYQNSIKYKSLTSEGSQISEPECEIQGHELLCKLKELKVDFYVFGIGNSLVSSKMITVFSYSSPKFVETFGSKKCLILSLVSNKELDVELTIPNKYLPKDFAIQINQPKSGIPCNKASSTDNNKDKYSCKCSVDKLQEGNYEFTLLLESQYSITLKQLNFEIKDYERISGIFPESLYRISEAQDFTLSFKENIPSGVITSIQFKNDLYSSSNFTLSKDSTNNQKVFTIENLDSDNLDLQQYEVYINSPCLDDSMIPTDKKITLKTNPIDSVSPDYVVIKDPNSSSTIKFKYNISKKQDKLNFGNSYFISLTDKSTNSITISSKDFSEQNIYHISILDIFDENTDTDFQLQVFEDKIQLESSKSYVYVETQVDKLIIPLVNGILNEQLLNVTSDKIEIKGRKLINNGKEIELTLDKFFTENEIGSYYFEIVDKAYPNEALTYTLICDSRVNLAVANITINIDNPAKNGQNKIKYTFERYETSNIKNITYTKVNRQTGEESQFVCCYGNECNCSIVKNELISDSFKQEISTNIIYTSEEKFLYKYVLKSIADDVYERTFKKDDYVLLDFAVSQNIFGFLNESTIELIETKFQLYDETLNGRLNSTIKCEIETKEKLECEDGKDCGNSCDVECFSLETGEMNCKFKFPAIKKEATILYRFSEERDKHPKPLHIIRLVPPPSLCRPVTFTQNVELQVCVHRQVNDLVLYLNDEDPSENCGRGPLKTEAEKCTSIYIEQDYLHVEESFKMKVIRNQNYLNTFTLETEPPTITFFNEAMQSIGGQLYAQYVHNQIISYIFPQGSDASLISTTLTKKSENQDQRILTAESCKVNDNKKNILECLYNLKDKIDYEDLGLYEVSYTHSTCGSEVFTTKLKIEVKAPQIILSSISHDNSWLGEVTEFTLGYTYLFYTELEETIPKKLVLVNVDGSENKTVVLKYDKSNRQTLTFKSEIKFVSPGTYYIIEQFTNGNEDIPHKNTKIIFYYHPIEINPTNVTYYTDEPAPESVTTKFTYPIIEEQISSVTLGSKDVTYEFTPENITFIFTPGLINFTEGNTHNIIIRNLTGHEIVFTVEVIYVTKLEEAEITIIGPEPGYENQTNYVVFKSNNYNLTKLTRIKFSTLNESGVENDYIIDKNTLLEKYSMKENAIILPLFLYHNSYYKSPEVYNDDLNEKLIGFNYVLIGFFIERHFYIYDKSETSLFYHINCYTDKNAQNVLEKLQINDGREGACNITNLNRYMIQCSYIYDKDYTPKTLEISFDLDNYIQNEEIIRNLNEEKYVLKVYLINAETDKTCFTTMKQDQKTTLTLTTSENIGAIKSQLGDITTSEHMPISGKVINGITIFTYQLELTIPEVYEAKTILPEVYFQRNAEEFFFIIPNMQFNIINYAKFVNITQKFIHPSPDSQIFLTLTFSHALSNSDISHVILNKGEDVQHTLTDCSVYSHAKLNKVFTCDLSEIIKKNNLDGTFKVQPYDTCGNAFELQGEEVKVVFSNTYNNLYQISPKSTTLNALEHTTFSLIYRTTLKKGPKKIVLLRYADETETDYRINFEKEVIFPENKELIIYFTKPEKGELGLFKIKSIFDDDGITREDISDVSILIYQNEIQLEKEDELKPFGTEMENVTILLREEIIPEQISMISYFVKNKKEDEIETTWTVNNGKEIIVSFGKTITIDDNYIIIIYDAKDENKKIFTIKAEVLIDFEFSREFIDLENDNSVEITIKPINNDGRVIEMFETKHQDAQIETVEERELIYNEDGSIDTKYQKYFRLKFTKSEYFKPVVELTFKYYYTDIKESFNIKQTVKITDSSYPFFNYGGIDTDIYKGAPFKIQLLDNQHFSKMYYEDLQAYLLINRKKEHLIQDLNDPRTFYYANSTENFAGLTGELIIYEKNNENAIVDRGLIITFDTKDKPDISNDPCNNQGSLVDGICKCLNGLFGANCTFTKSNVDDAASEYIKEIEGGVDIKNPEVLPALVNLAAIAKEIKIMLPDLSGQIENFENTTPQDEPQALGYYAWASLIIEGSKHGKRNLAESVRQKVLKRTKQTAQEFIMPFDKEYMKMVMPLQNIYYHKIRSSKKAFDNYINSNKLAQVSYVELKEIKEESDKYYLLSANEGNENNSTDISIISLNLEMISGDNRLLEEVKIDTTALLHFSHLDIGNKDVQINYDLFKEYKSKGIDIYNIEDPAFSDKCYSTNPKKFDYDLTQEYRKTNIYQRVSFALDNANCKFLGMDQNPGFSTFECPQENKVYANLEVQMKPLNDKVINHLALKCIGELSGLGKNIALWVFLIILLLTSAVIVLIKLNIIKEPQLVTFPVQQNVVCTTANEEMNGRKVSDIQFGIQKSFFDIFKYNLKNYYPVVALFFRENRLNNVVIFVFSLFTLFGFNAIYFTENHIEDRIYNNSRSKFNYPVNNEADVIFASIFTSLLVLAVVRLLALLIEKLKEKDLQNQTLHMVLEISFGVFCLAFSFFFWVYCIGFCGMYKNTQSGWIFACIWSLFFNWIVFGPVYMFVVSFIEWKLNMDPEFKEEYKLMFYIKELLEF